MLKQFKELPQGYYRLLIVGWIVLPILAGIIAESSGSNYSNGSNFLGALILGIPIYYVLARLGIWIYDGFKNSKTL